jgi:uncharacterized protein (TIGR03437 family)
MRMLVLLLLAPLTLRAVVFNIQGGNLIVTSSTLQVSFRGPEVVGITNQITGENYFRTPGPNSAFGLQTLQGASGAVTVINWVLNDTRTAATFTESDSTRTMSLTVSVDSSTQEVVLAADGRTTQPGAIAFAWDANGFDMTAGKFILPAGGGLSISAATLAKLSPLSFGEEYTSSTQHWEAPLALFQGAQGGASIYSSDLQSQFKDLNIAAGPQQTAMAVFSVQAPGPWNKAVEAGPVEWRLAAYQGDWQAGARVYRDWHNGAAPPVPAVGGRAWIGKIRTVVRLQFPPYSPAQADALAKVVNPAQTLLYIVQWRADGYDKNYPNYVADPSIKPLIDHAHQLGFHVMLHANMMAVTQTNPDFAAVQQYQVKDARFLQPEGWGGPVFAYIDPAAAAYRNLFLNRITNALQTLQPDALHLDQSGFPWNDGNGIIDSMNYIQGSVQLHKDLLAAFPNLVLGGEGIYGGIAPFQSFAQMGHAESSPLFNPSVAPPVPITAYVLANVHFYGGLGEPNPDELDFLNRFQMFDGQAILPDYYELLSNVGEVPNYKETDFARYMKVVSAVQQNDLVPDWDANWNGAIMRYKGLNGASGTLTDSGVVVQFNVQAAAGAGIVYQRVRDSNQLTSPGAFVPGWPAYSGNQILGLDPAYQYWLDATPPDLSLTHINSLPSGVRLGLGAGTLVTPDFAYFSLLPPAGATQTNATADVQMSVPASVSPSSILTQGGTVSAGGGSASIKGLPLNSTVIVFVTSPRAVTAGQSLLDIPATMSQTAAGRLAGAPDNPYCACPLFGIGPQTSGGVAQARAIVGGPVPNTQNIFSWAVQLPASSALSLSFGAGFSDPSSPAHDVLLTVRVNGLTLWQYDLPPQVGWHYGVVDLSAWQGKNALIELLADSLNANPSAAVSWTGLTLGGAGGTCSASLDSVASIAAPAAGAAGAINVSSASGCNWSAGSTAPWITVRPSAGSGNGVVNYVVSSNSGPARQATMTIAGHALAVNQVAAPVPTIQAIADSWNYTPGVAPGAWVTITGTALTSGPPQTWNLSGTQQLPTTLGGVSVTFNGALAALYYVSPTQINALVPASVVPGPVQVMVQTVGSSSSPFTINAAATRPSIYALPNFDGSSFFVTAALQGTGFLVGNTAVDPRVVRAALPGDILDLYMGGLGATADPSKFVTNQVFSGAYPVSTPIAATVGGEQAQVIFAGLTSPGLYLVRIAIPSDLTAGPKAIQISTGGSQTSSSLVLMLSASTGNLLQNGSFESAFTGIWQFSVDRTTGAAATVQRDTSTAVDGSSSAEISVASAGSPSGSLPAYVSVQFWQGGVALQQGHVYMLQFSAKADAARTLRLGVSQNGGAFQTYGISTAVSLGGDWQRYVLYFQSTATDPAARLNFYFGDQPGNTWLDNVTIE